MLVHRLFHHGVMHDVRRMAMHGVPCGAVHAMHYVAMPSRTVSNLRVDDGVGCNAGVGRNLPVLILLALFGGCVPLVGALHGMVESLGCLLGVSANFLFSFPNSLADLCASAILSKHSCHNGKYRNNGN